MIVDDQGRVRVVVVEAAGTEVLPGLYAADPEAAKPHFNRHGWMADAPCPMLGGRNNPRIELDTGEILWGVQCWWDYVPDPSDV